MTRRLREYLAEEEVAVLLAYAISGAVLLVGGLTMALIGLGVVDLGIGPD